MPTVQDNRAMWDREYHWADQGDEWSAPWGGAAMQWYGTILPRIHAFVPTDRILEISCGHGRWTQYLKDLCRSLVAVDLSERCVEACRARFAGCPHITYVVNDGQSLSMVPDASVDFVFSFDSLVHADESVMRAYISQLPRLLKRDGAAFLHHSNLGEYRHYLKIRQIPKLEGLLRRLGVLEHVDARDFGVTARTVESLAEASDLRCISQEIVPWGTRRTFIDCMSVIVPKDSPVARGNRVLRNARFNHEVGLIRRLSRLYRLDEPVPSRRLSTPVSHRRE